MREYLLYHASCRQKILQGHQGGVSLKKKLTIIILIDCLSGVLYHPKDESMALMLNDSAASINRTLTFSQRLSIDIISIKANSAKDLLLIGNYFHILISQSVSQSVRQAVSWSASQPLGKWVSHASVRQYVSQSVSQSVRQYVSTSQSVRLSVCLSFSGLVGRSINPSVSLSVSQAVRQLAKQLVSQAVIQGVSLFAYRYICP